jgi:hypothetical protein
MDSISDSDSEDVGSIPTGTTNKNKLRYSVFHSVVTGGIPTSTT